MQMVEVLNFRDFALDQDRQQLADKIQDLVRSKPVQAHLELDHLQGERCHGSRLIDPGVYRSTSG